MKKSIKCCLLLILGISVFCTAPRFQSVYAAETAEEGYVITKIRKGGKAGEPIPTFVSRYENDEEYAIIKTYPMTEKDDPTAIPTEDIEEDGRVYTFSHIEIDDLEDNQTYQLLVLATGVEKKQNYQAIFLSEKTFSERMTQPGPMHSTEYKISILAGILCVIFLVKKVLGRITYSGS